MMEQSKKEIAAFINSLVPADDTAENQPIVPAAAGEVVFTESSAGADTLVTTAETLPLVAAVRRWFAICVPPLRVRCRGRILAEPGPACRGTDRARFRCRGWRRRC
jgi:hypothetical protein